MEFLVCQLLHNAVWERRGEESQELTAGVSLGSWSLASPFLFPFRNFLGLVCMGRGRGGSTIPSFPCSLARDTEMARQIVFSTTPKFRAHRGHAQPVRDEPRDQRSPISQDQLPTGKTETTGCFLWPGGNDAFEFGKHQCFLFCFAYYAEILKNIGFLSHIIFKSTISCNKKPKSERGN